SPTPSASPTPTPTPKVREEKPLLGDPRFNAVVTNPNDGKVTRGGSCVIQVRLPEGLTNCGGFTIDLTYDTSRMRVGNASSPLNTGSNVAVINKTYASNKVRMVYVTGTIGSPAVLYGEMFSVSFTVPDTATFGEGSFSVSVAEICDAYGQPIPGIGTGNTAALAVIPPAPTVLNATVTGHSYATVNWTPVDTTAVYYNIYRKVAGGSWSLLDTVRPGTSAYADRNIRVSTSYYYTVQPFVLINGARLHGPYDTTGKLAVVPPPAKPVLSRTWIVNGNTIGVSWNATSGAGAYTVYRKVIGGSWKLMGDATGTSYIDSTASRGTTYYYTAQAYSYNGSGQKAYGDYDTTGITARIPYPNAPNVSVDIAGDYSGVNVSWGAVSNVAGYAVYRRLANVSDWTVVNAGTTGTSFKDTTAIRGYAYYYTVQAYTTGTDGSKIWGAYDTTGRMASYAEPGVTPLTSVYVNNANSVTVYWGNAPRSPYGYYILRKTGANGSWQSIRGVIGNNYTDNTVKPGTTYYYSVQAYCVSNGNVIVYAPYNSTGLMVKTPILDAPALVSATPTASNAITVKWNTVPFAGDYVVLRRLSGSWSPIATVSGTSYTDTTAVAGNPYYYSVQAIARDGLGNISYGNYNSTGLNARIPYNAAPAVQAVASPNYASIQLSWNAVSGAAGYTVYRKLPNAAGWSALAADITSTTFTDATAVRGTRYLYTVQSYAKLSNGTKVWGAYNTAGVSCMISAPGLTPLSSIYVTNPNSITIGWNPAPHAPTGYYVLRKVGANGSWKSLGVVSGTSFTDTTTRAATTYYYTVQAYCTAYGGVRVYGAYNTTGIAGTTASTGMPQLVSTTPIARTSITVKWNPVPYANGYCLLRKVAGGSWKLITTTSSTSYTDTSAVPGTQYYYSAQSYAYNGLGNMAYGGYNATGIVAQIPYTAAPTVSVSALTSTSVRVRWNAVSGARGYAVYRRVDGSNVWTVLASGLTGTTFVDTTLSRGVAYYYTVEGYTTLPNGTNIWGAYDPTGKIIGLP
ncbi:MAG: hypothetical protein Q4E65_08560, partial [Clostridia bacterium]|nr:hypothetical protein [Clostridia bacterium]